jgi:hypothetical protein
MVELQAVIIIIGWYISNTPPEMVMFALPAMHTDQISSLIGNMVTLEDFYN